MMAAADDQHDRTTAPVVTVALRLVTEKWLGLIYRDVEQVYPEEGCGFLFEGTDGGLQMVTTKNRATLLHQMDPEAYPRDGRTYFEPDMKPWLRAEREGLTPRLIYHSHPEHEAYFSQTDRLSALIQDTNENRVVERHPGVVHLVVSVRGADAPTARCAKLFGFDPSTRDFVALATYDEAGQLADKEIQ
jgi:proteasome lid subunit RPN8/RPN11